MKIEVWYAVNENGLSRIFSNKPKRFNSSMRYHSYWYNLTTSNSPIHKALDAHALTTEEVKELNLPMLTWEDEPIKLELDIQAMVING